MGRHRRSDAGRAATSRAAGATHHDGSYGEGLDARGAGADGPPTMGTAPYLNPEAYAETYARSEAYLYATDETAVPAGGTGFATTGGYPDAGPAPAPAAYAYTASAADTVTAPTVSAPTVPGPRTAEYDFTGHSFAGDPLPEWDVTPRPRPVRTARTSVTSSVGADDRPPANGRRRKKKAATPVRTGLLGVSAAVAIGTVAVATGAVPGLENYKLGGDSGASDNVQAGAGVATSLPTEQGGTSGPVETPGRDASTPRAATAAARPPRRRRRRRPPRARRRRRPRRRGRPRRRRSPPPPRRRPRSRRRTAERRPAPSGRRATRARARARPRPRPPPPRRYCGWSTPSARRWAAARSPRTAH